MGAAGGRLFSFSQEPPTSWLVVLAPAMGCIHRSVARASDVFGPVAGTGITGAVARESICRFPALHLPALGEICGALSETWLPWRWSRECCRNECQGCDERCERDGRLHVRLLLERDSGFALPSRRGIRQRAAVVTRAGGDFQWY